MQHSTKYYGNVQSRSGYKPINFDLIRFLLSLLLMLLVTPASAAPTSALLKGIMQGSYSNPDPGQSTIDTLTFAEEIKKKLAVSNAELARLPSEAVADAISYPICRNKEYIILDAYV